MKIPDVIVSDLNSVAINSAGEISVIRARAHSSWIRRIADAIDEAADLSSLAAGDAAASQSSVSQFKKSTGEETL